MNVEVDELAVVSLQNLRKRKRNEAAWKKNKAKCALAKVMMRFLSRARRFVVEFNHSFLN